MRLRHVCIVCFILACTVRVRVVYSSGHLQKDIVKGTGDSQFFHYLFSWASFFTLNTSLTCFSLFPSITFDSCDSLNTTWPLRKKLKLNQTDNSLFFFNSWFSKWIYVKTEFPRGQRDGQEARRFKPHPQHQIDLFLVGSHKFNQHFVLFTCYLRISNKTLKKVKKELMVWGKACTGL